jgi:hypothetical protein
MKFVNVGYAVESPEASEISSHWQPKIVISGGDSGDNRMYVLPKNLIGCRRPECMIIYHSIVSVAFYVAAVPKNATRVAFSIFVCVSTTWYVPTGSNPTFI